MVCFSGDGAFYYHLTELETQRRRQIPLVTVINNNSGFGQGVYKVNGLYEGRSGSPEELNRFGPTDFAAIARDFGIDGARIEDPADLAPALKIAVTYKNVRTCQFCCAVALFAAICEQQPTVDT